MSDMNDVLNALIAGTTNAKVKWFRSANANEFVSTIGSLSAVVRRVGSPGFGSSERFLLEVVDDEGSTVEALESDDGFAQLVSERRANSEQAKRLGQLFLLARRSALDIPNTLGKLVSDINAD